jgi:hypothetical protein
MASMLPPARRLWGMLVLCCALFPALVLLTSGCGDFQEYISEALPPSPSPFPTMARLPSVTPVTPSATLAPTFTPQPTLTATPTLVPVYEGIVAVGANVRSGPGIEFSIVTSVVAGTQVTLLERQGEWLRVDLDEDTEGWMSEQVIELDPAVATAIPQAEAEEGTAPAGDS